MKTNQTLFMSWRFAVLCSFFFGLGQHSILALPSCANSCCELIYSWTPDRNMAYSAQVSGTTDPFAANKNTTSALLWVYLPAATSSVCSSSTSGKFDIWEWDSWFYSCQSGGIYPVTQQVTVTDPSPTLSQAGVTRFICVAGS